MTKGFFVSGTDTGIGKTVTSAVLCVRLGADYYKPVQSGAGIGPDQIDSTEVARLAPGVRVHPSAYELAHPLSPHEAARLEGVRIEPATICLPDTDRPLVVEGAGGLLVPLTDTETMIDLIDRLGLPVILVARSTLGTINHTLLSIEALRARGIALAGVVLVGEPDLANRQAIETRGRARIIGEIPVAGRIDADFVRQAALGLDPPPVQADRPVPDVATLAREHVWLPFTQEETAPPPVEIVSAHGARLTTADGRQLLDLVSSWWVTLHGHGHPRIARAIADQAATLDQALLADFMHRPAALLASRLAELLPGDLSRVFYSDNGSTAVEVGLKICHQYWRNQGQQGRDLYLAFEGGYHGDTVGAMSVGRSCGYFAGFEPLTFEVRFLPYPATWIGDEEILDREDAALRALDRVLAEQGERVAGVLVEPLVQGAAGMRMCRPRFLAELAARVRRAGLLLVFDEVMTGFGRTGTMFACQRAGITPDVICLAKGITGGLMPLAVTVCRESLHQAFLGPTFSRALAHGHSYTGNPLGCAAALASLAVFEEERTLARLADMERLHLERIASLNACPGLARPRVTGTIAAVDVTADSGSYASAFGRELKARFMDRGLFIRPLGNVVYLMPPYGISNRDLHRAWDVVIEVLSRL